MASQCSINTVELQDMNPLIEIADTEIVNQLVDMFDVRKEEVEWSLVFDDHESELILDLNVANDCVPLQFSVHLELNNDENVSYGQ